MRPSDNNKLSAALERSEAAEAAGDPMPQPVQAPPAPEPAPETPPVPDDNPVAKEERVLAPPLEFEKKLHRIRLSRLRSDLDSIRACLVSMQTYRSRVMEEDDYAHKSEREKLKTRYEKEAEVLRNRFEFALDEMDARRIRCIEASEARYKEDSDLFMGQARDIERTIQVVEIGIGALDKA